jgi:hypothetical protein
MFIVIVCISFRQAIKDGDLPRKRKTAHLAIKTNGLLKHVSLSGTSLFQLPPWRFTRLAHSAFLSFLLLDVLMPRIVSNPIIKFNRVQKKSYITFWYIVDHLRLAGTSSRYSSLGT